MKDSKNKRTIILALILIAALAVAFKLKFMPSSEDDAMIEQNSIAGDKAVMALAQLGTISFDTSVIEDFKFQSLRSIDKPLPPLPVGKKNPFSQASN